MKNLFKELKKNRVNHFVTISRPAIGVFFGGGGEEDKTYTVFVLRSDLTRTVENEPTVIVEEWYDGLKFINSYDNDKLSMIELKESQINEFLLISDDNYEEVNHIDGGCILELKNDSFKEYYDRTIQLENDDKERIRKMINGSCYENI